MIYTKPVSSQLVRDPGVSVEGTLCINFIYHIHQHNIVLIFTFRPVVICASRQIQEIALPVYCYLVIRIYCFGLIA